MNKKIIGATFIFACIFGVSSVAHALTLTPIRLEISGDPGQTVVQQMTLINEQPTAETYYSSYDNFEAQGETGTPTFVPATEDLGTWMEVPTSITLAAGESKTVPIKINIPVSADPGGHFAAIFWGTTPTASAPGSVAIGAKTGMLVLLTVSGPVNEKGGVIEFATQNKQTFFTSLPVSLYYRFQNSGGDRIKPTGNIVFKNIFGLTSAKIDGNPVEGNILPNSIRRFETVWQGGSGPTIPKDQGNFFTQVGYEWNNFALGRYNAHLNLTYGTGNEVATAVFSFWVFPWHLIVFLIIILLLLFFFGRYALRSYNNWVISKAKEMIRNEDVQGNKIDGGLHSNKKI